MKLTTLCLLGCSSIALAQLPFQQVPNVTRTGDICNMDWESDSSLTYFVQYSFDMVNWTYMPIIESGTGSPIGYGFQTVDEKMFVRLHYTNIPTSNPNGDDFDGDGISNWDEVRAGGTGTSPLIADTNGDGIRDDGLVYAAQADPDGVGLSVAMQSGLLGRWDFENLQGSFPAQYFPDSTNNANHATIFSGATSELSDAIISKSCKIPGVGYLSVPPTIMDGVRTFNISMWIKPTAGSLTGANAAKTRVIWSYGDQQTALPLLFLYLQNGNNVILQRYSGSVLENVASWVAPENLDDGKWRHLSFAREDGGVTGTEYKLYINGQKIGASWGGLNHSFGNNPNGYFLMGRLTSNNALTQFDGLIDRVLFHDRGLSEVEAKELYDFDSDGDGLYDWYESDYRKDRVVYFDDASLDDDDDDLTNLEEQAISTHPRNFDSDGDLLPDGFEHMYLLNPLSTASPNGTQDDPDGDGLTNIDEVIYQSDPNKQDSDGDGVNDNIEATQGSFANDASDNGQAPDPAEIMLLRLGVGDPSSSHSERYYLQAIDLETGQVVIAHQAPTFGEIAQAEYKQFRKGKSYSFSIRHAGTKPGQNQTDYDYFSEVVFLNAGDESSYLKIDAYDPVSKKKANPSNNQKVLEDKLNSEGEPEGTGDNGASDFKETIEKYEALFLAMGMTSDINRDGKIDDSDKGQINEANPLRFWVNNDGDSISSPIDVPIVGIGDSVADFEINGLRDLIDFFPLKIDIKDVLTKFPPNQYTYTLESDDQAFNFMETDLSEDSVDVYLTGQLGEASVPDNANGIVVLSQVHKEMIVKRSNQISGKLSKAFLTAIAGGQKDGIILVEANKESQNPLKLVVRKGNTGEVGEYQLPVSMNHVESMYRHINLMGEDDLLPEENVGRPTEVGVPSGYPDSLCNDKYFVFLHGYNVNGHIARGWNAEFFKRMWWSGSRARFVGVTWHGSETQGGAGLPEPFPTLIPGSLTPNLQINVVNAFKTADGLATALTALNGEITISAHSLGNMVVSSAIHDHSAPIKNYFMIDAAVAIEAYDAAAPKQASMLHPDWVVGYPDQAMCSEWHLLPWASGDGRKQLTWRGRLSNRRNTTYYNFYSSGEEILRNHDNGSADNFFSFTDEQLAEQFFGDGATGIYAWAYQEKLKGRTLTGHIQGSRWGGWGFNIQRKPAPLVDWNPTHAATFTAAEMMENPYWRRGGEDVGFTEPHPNLFVAGAVGSNYAIQNRDLLLAEGFPSRTFAAGANAVNILGAGNNFDMMTMKNGWHNGGITDWLHSDIKAVSYLYTNKVYKKFVDLGGLN